MVYRGGPEGRSELARLRGRDEIIARITAGWARTAATWYPGAMIHLIGSHVIDRSAAGGCAAGPTPRSSRWTDGVRALKGYGAYDDIWVPDEGEWRLASRETVMYGSRAANSLRSGLS